MILAFLISVAGCWGALMVLGTFGIVLWNALVTKLKLEHLCIVTTKKTLVLSNVVISLVFNTVYFYVSFCC